ncbi:MAG: hypothetical protein N2316_11650 [Spirochaetes bacterium]|nr:hypothetical protein [Spirochaetota bacterium]
MCAESGINATLTERMSKNYTFVSYTVSAIFPSEDILKMLCARIGNLEGFMLMF